MKITEDSDHKLWTLWAAECAEHVLYLFEKDYPADDRPRIAIEAARAWTKGEMKASDARIFALAANAAARDATHYQGIAAARAAGHAAATTHVADHAIHAAAYAVKASTDTEKEKEWQWNIMPEHLRVAVEEGKIPW